MESKEILIGIVIPIISSIIGGGLTVLGVILTIKNVNDNRKDEIRLANKPFFYVIDPHQDYDYKNSSDYILYPEENKNTNGHHQFIFKNTDNAILILDYIEINNTKYYPQNGNVVDKNTIFNTYIYTVNDTLKNDSNKIIFSIKDSLNNSYKYNLEYSNDKITGYSEID